LLEALSFLLCTVDTAAERSLGAAASPDESAPLCGSLKRHADAFVHEPQKRVCGPLARLRWNAHGREDLVWEGGRLGAGCRIAHTGISTSECGTAADVRQVRQVKKSRS
jgi:hypothetical protein